MAILDDDRSWASASPTHRALRRVASTSTCLAGVVARSALIAARYRADCLRERAELLSVTAGRIVRIHGIDVRVEGAPLRRVAIYVANHVSYLDPLIIAERVCCTAIAKGELASWPIVGARLDDLGVLFVERGNVHSGAKARRDAESALFAGVSVLNFPEGTTTTGERTRPFHRGVFGIARRFGVPLVPVRIDYDDPALAWVGDASFLPHYLAVAGRRRVGVRLRFGEPIDAPQNRSARELADISRAVIERSLTARPRPRPRSPILTCASP